MSDGTGLAEMLLGLDELVVTIETTTVATGCAACGTRAVAHERTPIAIRDLAWLGRPVRLV